MSAFVVLLADTWQPDHSTDTLILFGGSQEFIDGCVGYANVFRNALALALLCLPAAQHFVLKVLCRSAVETRQYCTWLRHDVIALGYPSVQRFLTLQAVTGRRF